MKRLLFPPPKPTPGGDVGLPVLLLLAVLMVLGPVRENLVWGRQQGCAYVYAGIGFACGPDVPPGAHEVAYPYPTDHR